MTPNEIGLHSRRGHRAAAGWSGLVVGLVCATVWAGSASGESLEVGQRWRYRHEGPRPGSVEPNAIDGERILWVLRRTEGKAGVQWVVEERFTRDEKAIGRFCIGPDGRLEAVEIENERGETARLRYDPPTPYQPSGMAVGETKMIETVLRMDSVDFALPTRSVTERLADETIVTPTGEFTGCSRYRTVTTSTFNVKIAKIPFTEERERWYHPAVGGMVKEVYRRGPIKFLGWSRPGYTSGSVLIAYDRQEPPPADPNHVSRLPAREEQEPAPKKTHLLWGFLIVPATLLILVGVFIAARRKRK